MKINKERYKKALAIVFVITFLITFQFMLNGDLDKRKVLAKENYDPKIQIGYEQIFKENIIIKPIIKYKPDTPFILKEIETFTVKGFSKDKESRKNEKNIKIMENWEGINVAVDPKIIPYGTKIWIPGLGIRQTQPSEQFVKGTEILVYFENVEDKIKYGEKELLIYEVME